MVCHRLGEHLDQQEDLMLLRPLVARRCVVVGQISFEVVDRSRQVAQGLARLALQHSERSVQVRSAASGTVSRLQLSPGFEAVAGKTLHVSQRFIGRVCDEKVVEFLVELDDGFGAAGHPKASQLHGAGLRLCQLERRCEAAALRVAVDLHAFGPGLVVANFAGEFPPLIGLHIDEIHGALGLVATACFGQQAA